MVRKIKVILQPVKFRKRDHIAVLSLNNPYVDEIVRDIEGAEWSTGYRFWHVPYRAETLEVLNNELGKIAVVDKSAFKNFSHPDQPDQLKKKKRIKVPDPGPEQKKILKTVETEFLKNYSDSTVKIYMCLLNVFFGYFSNKPESEITREDIEDFLVNYIDKHNYSLNYKRSMINTIKRYFQIRGKEEMVKGIF
ncbi:MAG: phage integrase N-terminal SAM-like domain-containing protein [Prolixibacteraceae bacterium]|nr:phage integrase N-terminal SAM-like domain-containing protein [Prolixibacteraceae bacterium]